MNRIHLVSFADGAFHARKQPFITGAMRFGHFDSITVFDFDMLPFDFRRDHSEFMKTNKRGFGYWIWKPEIILQRLSELDENELLIYMDAGFTLNSGGQDRFAEYVQLSLAHPMRMLSFQNIHTEAHWTKADLACRVGLAQISREMLTSQLGSGLIFLSKTLSNIDLLKEWKELSVADNYRYSDDSPSEHENHPLFKEHRHDQSISSLLRKMRGTEITHYEVQEYKGYFEKYKSSFPAWATRLRE